MSLYWSFLRIAFKEASAYRVNFYLTLFGGFIEITILMSVWHALYAHRESMNGVTIDDMVTYVVIVFAVNALVASGIGEAIGKKVVDGSIVSDLLKPVDFKYYLFANELGHNLYHFIFRAVPIIACGILIWGIHLPSAPQILVFAIALINGLLIIFHINYIFGLTTFWLKTAFYVRWLQNAFWLFASGAVVPLWFYPETLYQITLYLPFRYIVFEPLQIYLGTADFKAAFMVVLYQIVWLSLLIPAAGLFWKRVQHKLEIHGG